MKTILAVLVAATAAWAGEEGAVESRFPRQGLSALRVETEAGKIVVRAAAAGAAEATAVEAGPSAGCKITKELRGGELLLKAEGTWLRSKLGKPCRAGFVVTAPAGIPAAASSGSGDIELRGLAGGVDVDAGSGDVALEVQGPVKVRGGSGDVKGSVKSEQAVVDTGSGGVQLWDLVGSVVVDTGSGDVELSWTRAPQAGKADVSAGSGDVTLTFPPGAAFSSDVTAGVGRVYKELSDSPGAEFEVDVSAGSGDVRIKKG